MGPSSVRVTGRWHLLNLAGRTVVSQHGRPGRTLLAAQDARRVDPGLPNLQSAGGQTGGLWRRETRDSKHD
jgi:hypothetical protein